MYKTIANFVQKTKRLKCINNCNYTCCMRIKTCHAGPNPSFDLIHEYPECQKATLTIMNIRSSRQ